LKAKANRVSRAASGGHLLRHHCGRLEFNPFCSTGQKLKTIFWRQKLPKEARRMTETRKSSETKTGTVPIRRTQPEAQDQSRFRGPSWLADLSRLPSTPFLYHFIDWYYFLCRMILSLNHHRWL